MGPWLEEASVLSQKTVNLPEARSTPFLSETKSKSPKANPPNPHFTYFELQTRTTAARSKLGAQSGCKIMPSLEWQ